MKCWHAIEMQKYLGIFPIMKISYIFYKNIFIYFM